MPPRPIVVIPHKVLRAAAAEVPLAGISSASIRRLVSDMKQTLAASPDGVGLASPQAGVPLRIFIVSSEAEQLNANKRIDVPRPECRDGGLKGLATNAANKKKAWEYHVFINPVLKKHSRKKTEMAEGCLSLPGKFGVIKRPEKVAITWYDEKGQRHSRGFTGFFSRVIQHEMDHLDGILIADRAKKLISIPKGNDLTNN